MSLLLVLGCAIVLHRPGS